MASIVTALNAMRSQRRRAILRPHITHDTPTDVDGMPPISRDVARAITSLSPFSSASTRH